MNIFHHPTDLSVVLVRACTTDLECQGRIAGSLDMPLSTQGEIDARQIADGLDQEIDVIISAACLAAQQTALELARHGKPRVRVEEGLTNLDHGLWHGKSLEELKETQPKLFRQWQDNPETVRPPSGETIDEVRLRVSSTLKRIRRKYKSGTVAIVAPEPLLSIIRSEVEHAAILEIDFGNGKSTRWNEISLASDAIG